MSPEFIVNARPPAKRPKVKKEEDSDNDNEMMSMMMQQSADSTALLSKALARFDRDDDEGAAAAQDPVVTQLKSILSNPSLSKEKRQKYELELLEIKEEVLEKLKRDRKVKASKAHTPVLAQDPTVRTQPVLNSAVELAYEEEGNMPPEREKRAI